MKETKIINYVMTMEGTKEYLELTEEQRREMTEQLHLALNYRFVEEKHKDMSKG